MNEVVVCRNLVLITFRLKTGNLIGPMLEELRFRYVEKEIMKRYIHWLHLKRLIIFLILI